MGLGMGANGEFYEFIKFEGALPGMSYRFVPKENVLRSLQTIRDGVPNEVSDFFLDEAEFAIRGFTRVLAAALISADVDVLKRLQTTLREFAAFERQMIDDIVFNDIVKNFDTDPDSDDSDADAAS